MMIPCKRNIFVSAGLFSRSGTSGFGLQQCATQSKPFGFGQTTTTVGAGCLFGMTQPATTGTLCAK